MRFSLIGLLGGVFFSSLVVASDVVPILATPMWTHGIHMNDIVNVEMRQTQEGKYQVSQVDELKLAYGNSDLGAFFNAKTGAVYVYVPSKIDINSSTGKFICGKNIGLAKDSLYDAPADVVFCTSTFIDRVKEPVAQKGFSMMMKLASGVASAGMNVVDTFEAELSQERIIAVLSNPDVVSGLTKVRDNILNAALIKQAEQAKIETYKKSLFDKGQHFIQQSAVGETLCTNAGDYRVYAFIENVRGQKVQLRVNRISTKSHDETSITIKGLNYRNGEVIWSDAALWSACQ